MTTVKEEIQKFEGYLRTLEFKLFGGKLHQKVQAPHTGQTPAFAYLPVDEHEGDAPEPGTYPKDDPRYVDPNVPPPGGEGQTGDVIDPPHALAATGNAQVDPAKAEPVRYGDEGEIPPAPPAVAPQPADVAAVKGNPAAKPPKA